MVKFFFYFLQADTKCTSFNSNTKQTPTKQRACALTQLVLEKESSGAVAKMKGALMVSSDNP